MVFDCNDALKVWIIIVTHQSHGYIPAKSELISGRLFANATSASLMSIAEGMKNKPKSTTLLHPCLRISSVSSTTSVIVVRA